MSNSFVNIDSNVKEDGNILLNSSKSIFNDSFYFQDIFNMSEYRKLIKNAERLIRRSKEYTAYLGMIKNKYEDLNRDNVLSNIDSSDAEIEMHHYPLSLYDICDTVASHRIFHKIKLTTFSLAKEVMECHFKNIVGLVPLSRTLHELAHTNNLFISKDQVFGNYKRFLEEYKNGIPSDISTKMKLFIKNSESSVSSDVRGLFDD